MGVKLFLFDHTERKHREVDARVMSESSVITYHDGSVAGEQVKITKRVFNLEYNIGSEEAPIWKSQLGVMQKSEMAGWQNKTYVELSSDAPAAPRIEPPEVIAEAVAAVQGRGYTLEGAQKIVEEYGARAILESIAHEKARAAAAPPVIVPVTPAPVPQASATDPSPEPQGPPKPPKNK